MCQKEHKQTNTAPLLIVIQLNIYKLLETFKSHKFLDEER